MPRLFMNVSRYDDYNRCPMYFHYRHEVGILPAGQGPALSFGTSIHFAVERWYNTKFDDKAAVDAFWQEFNQHEDLDPELGTYGERLVKGYATHWDSDRSALKEILSTEQALTADITDGSLTVTLVGRPDLIARTEVGSNKAWHIQHKTCAHNTSYDRYVQAYNLNWHERAYALLSRANGVFLNGTILNLIRKTKQVHVEGEHTFYREYVPLSDTLVEKFRVDALTVGHRILSEKENRPQNPRSCFDYNRLCPYYDLCAGWPLDRDDWQQKQPDYVDEVQERWEKQ